MTLNDFEFAVSTAAPKLSRFDENALAATPLLAGRATVEQSILSSTAHRPWPLPTTRWTMFMRWHDLIFLHWPVAPETLRPLIPSRVDLDTFDGQCWIGVVPFYMSGVRFRYLPLSFDFPELNVRTYVKANGKPGVWFFSLDAADWLAVRAARMMNLPYYDAAMSVERAGEEIRYRSTRWHSTTKFEACYRSVDAIYQAMPGTFDHWLTERYRLYAAYKSEKVVYGDIHHRPWSLQAAETDIRVNTMTEPIAVKLPDIRPICHFASLQEVVAWPIVKLKRDH